MDKVIFERNELLANIVVENLKKRNFEAFYCESKQSAVEKLSQLVSKEETITWGGSVTLDELNIPKYLKEEGYNVLDRDSAKTPQEREEIILKGFGADVFLMSTNALSQDGQLINIDGHGNRVAALCFGPKRVIVFAGMNKIAKTLEDAYSRARNTAAPINAKRVSSFFEINTPCLNSGSCADCKSSSSICSQIVTTRLCWPSKRITVILINDNLGY